MTKPRTDITHLVTATCSGFHAPGVDIQLIHEQIRAPAGNPAHDELGGGRPRVRDGPIGTRAGCDCESLAYMSSPTILFVLDRLRQRDAALPCVALGFGPGLTAEAMLFR